MKAYKELSPYGVKRRMASVVKLGLKEYDLDIHKVQFFAEETNYLYKLIDTSGIKYMAKIFTEESSTLLDNEVEAFMLKVIRDKGVAITNLVTTKDDSGVVVIKSDLTPEPKRMMIYEWVYGDDLDGQEDYKLFEKLGEETAKLHDITAEIEIPKTLQPKRFDKVFYFTGEVPVYKEERYQEFLSEEYHQIMDKLIPFVDIELRRMYEDYELLLIHGDMNPWNVLYKKDDGSFTIIDFEDSSLGHRLHDIAVSLYYYRYDENFDFEKVKESYYKGYQRISKLPKFDDYDLDIIMIARRLNFMNYVLLVDDDPKEFMDLCVNRINEYVDKYPVLQDQMKYQ